MSFRLRVVEIEALKRLYPDCKFVTFTKPQAIKAILEPALGYKMQTKLLPKSLIRATSIAGTSIAILDGKTWDVLWRQCS